jgi:hypothetical protein
VVSFTAFEDTVSGPTQYNIPGLCGLVYSISDPAVATTYGVTTTGLSISVITSNVALIGTTMAFELSATATPL